ERAMRAIIYVCAAVLCPGFAQVPEPQLSFEVASVKPNPLPPGRIIIRKYPNGPVPRATGNRYSQQPYATVQDLVMEAYGVHDFQISGLPDWAKALIGEHYDIEAKPPGEERPPG